MARDGFEHARPVVLFAGARPGADAAVPHDGGVGVRSVVVSETPPRLSVILDNVRYGRKENGVSC